MPKTMCVVAGMLLVALLLAGCSGGGGDGINWGLYADLGNSAASLTNADLAMADGSRIDLVTFQAPVDGTIEVQMQGGAVGEVGDPYLYVFQGEIVTIAQARTLITREDFLFDDDSGGGDDAALRFFVNAGDIFTVGFNSFDAGDIGSYDWTVDYPQNLASVAAADSGDKPADRAVAIRKAQ